MPETHWSVIHRLKAEDTVGRDRALAEVCRTYWQPLYSLARAWGRSPHDAEDLTQAFFSGFCERGGLGEVSPERGRFRACWSPPSATTRLTPRAVAKRNAEAAAWSK